MKLTVGNPLSALRRAAREMLIRSPLQYFPVRVRAGLAKGARWSMLPYSAYWRGDTEADIQAAIRQLGTLRDSVCWDLGTHFGIYTVGMAMAVGRNGHVYGFEPDAVSFKRCQRHLDMNGLTWAKIFPAAASDSDGVAELLLEDGSGQSTSRLPEAGEVTSKDTPRSTVRLMALDTLVERGEILPPVLVKVDVEGHGGAALRGAQKTIAAHLPVFVFSFHSPQELNETRAVLEPLGYVCFRPDGRSVAWPDCDGQGIVLRIRTAQE